jgi:hypothetical protein
MKKLLISGAILLIGILGYSQNHLKSQKAISLTAGYVSLGSDGSIPSLPINKATFTFDHIISNKWYEKMSLTMHTGEVGLVNFNQYLASYNIGYNFFNKEGLFLNATTGLQAGYETIKDFENTQTGKFIYGLNLGPEIEYFLTRKFGITLQAAQSIYFNSEFQLDKKFYLQHNYNVGVKFIL